jgi:hypothetical protein
MSPRLRAFGAVLRDLEARGWCLTPTSQAGVWRTWILESLRAFETFDPLTHFGMLLTVHAGEKLLESAIELVDAGGERIDAGGEIRIQSIDAVAKHEQPSVGFRLPLSEHCQGIYHAL